MLRKSLLRAVATLGLVAVALVVVGCDDGDSVRTAVVVQIDGRLVCAQPDEYPVYCFTAANDETDDLTVGSCIRTRSALDNPVGGDGTPENPERLLSLEPSDECAEG